MKMVVNHLVEWMIGREQKYSETTCSSAALSTADPIWLDSVRTRTAAVGRQRLTTWVMARKQLWWRNIYWMELNTDLVNAREINRSLSLRCIIVASQRNWMQIQSVGCVTYYRLRSLCVVNGVYLSAFKFPLPVYIIFSSDFGEACVRRTWHDMTRQDIFFDPCCFTLWEFDS
jgi:hypothetical protein